MKKILLVLPSFQHGGTVRSARSFVEKNNQNKVLIDVFCIQRIGDFEKYFKKCKILDENIELASCISLSSVFKGYSLIKKIIAIYYYIKRKVFKKNDRNKIFKKVADKIGKKTKYDCVLAFQEGLATDFARYIPAHKKIAWIRSDYSRYYQMVKMDESSIYEKYDAIICVSRYTANKFIEYIPNVKSKVFAIHNLIDYESIIFDSQKEIDDKKFDNSDFAIVSIGRMDPVKQFSKIPLVAEELKKKGCKFKWYIIGDGGNEKDVVLQKIEEYGVQENVILLGAKENPYPYVKQSDLLVCLSSSEACPNVINEAKILHVPIVTNSFPSVFEFITNNYNGIICEIEQMAEKIESLIKDPHIIDGLKENIKNFVYDNEQIMNNINLLILEE